MDKGGQGQLGQWDTSVVDKDDNGGSACIVKDNPWSNLLSFFSSMRPCCKPLVNLPYIRTFGAPDQGQTLDVQESQTTESALRDDWTWNVPHHTLEVVLEVTFEHMCTGLRP